MTNKHIDSYLTRLPKALRPDAENRYQDWLKAAAEADQRIPADTGFTAVQYRVFAASPFVAETCTRNPEILTSLLDSGHLLADSWPGVLSGRVLEQLQHCVDEIELSRSLRQLRSREMVRIAWRDVAGWASLDETLNDLSDLADACIRGALRRLDYWQAAETPAPKTLEGKTSTLVVVAMGKLGAHELNFSSDIDLIFAYPDSKPARKRGALSPEEYFTRLGQSLIHALSNADADGFVFRVDMRLRPYGNAGALVSSFDAMEDYYQSQGREWERYAMIKARSVTGDEVSITALEKLLRPFVYRRYLDFDAFDALSDLKRQIVREVERKGMQDNLKLGSGGIREIEFIAQAFQLVRGGQDAALRQRGVIAILRTLETLKLMSSESIRGLIAAYRFLRCAENRLQEMHDQQQHCLPEAALEQARLALAMGAADWQGFVEDLTLHRRHVAEQFQQVFTATAPQKSAADEPLAELWSGTLDDGESRQVLEEAGYEDIDEALRWLAQLHDGTAPHHLGKQGRRRFDALVPRVLAVVGHHQDAAELLARLVHILERIAGRTTYLTLLQENPPVLSLLVSLCAASAWIARRLAQFPLLLDELLDPGALYSSPDRMQLELQLDARLADIDSDDLEQQMDVLRQFRHAVVLRIAAADVTGKIEVMLVSDQLTQVAELVVSRVQTLAWQAMVRRYGDPGKVAFCVIGYGKAGGCELGYGSDLDLVFLHDNIDGTRKTRGREAVPLAVFLTRLGQRMIHMLETLTAAGTLYEVDMRLRPSGNSGMLVSTLEAFSDYQHHEAWTWEHQALVRARFISGDAVLGEAFQKTRAQILCQPRDYQKLQEDVRDMRERMRQELGARGRAGFHLKQDRGGIVDIEFMVQYLVLRWSSEHTELARSSSTIELLEIAADVGVLGQADAGDLADAYREYRAHGHALALAERSSLLDAGTFEARRKRVGQIWKMIMGM